MYVHGRPLEPFNRNQNYVCLGPTLFSGPILIGIRNCVELGGCREIYHDSIVLWFTTMGVTPQIRPWSHYKTATRAL